MFDIGNGRWRHSNGCAVRGARFLDYLISRGFRLIDEIGVEYVKLEIMKVYSRRKGEEDDSPCTPVQPSVVDCPCCTNC